jgi:O-methyltransferase
MIRHIYRIIIPKKLQLCVTDIRINIGKRLLHLPKNTFSGDGFTTTHYLGFRTDKDFKRAFTSSINSLPSDYPPGIETAKDIEWRAHICTWAAKRALYLEGDFVECGVWYGALSKTICEYLDFSRSDRKFYLIDSWGVMPGSHPAAYYQKDIYEDVKSRFEKYPFVELIRGVVPEILIKIPSNNIAYLAIDMNSSEPELNTLEYFYPKMVKGGIIYFDDYGWKYPALRKVIDEFFSSKPETLLHFPSGNSIAIKI